MTEPRKLRCYQYVNRPYERVRGALREDAAELFKHATTSAHVRADALASTLRVGIAGVEIGVDVRIHVGSIRDEAWITGIAPVTRMKLTWEATHATSLFPSMHAELSAWPLFATETQLEIQGEYRPPLGIVGKAADAMGGHFLAEAAVQSFLEDVVEQLRRELPTR